jgi:hypothetical protein
MALEFIVGALALLAYLVGCYADERRSRLRGRKLRRLRDSDGGRARMPAPSWP